MSKAKGASTTTTTRRSFLVTGSAAAAAASTVAGITIAPAIAATASGISPELQILVRTMEAARAELERLKKIDDEARLLLPLSGPANSRKDH